MPQYKTLNEITQDVVEALSQVYGTGVQTYSEDRIKKTIVDGFNLVFKQAFWPQFRLVETVTLDETTGVPTSNLTITDFSDIQAVYRDGNKKPLPKLPELTNPSMFTGTTPRYYDQNTANDDRCIKVYPITSEGDIVVVGRDHPGDIGDDDTIKMDDTLLKFYACWSYAADDGTNPAQVTKFQGLFDKRLQQLHKALHSGPVELDAATGDYLTEWQW